MLLTSQRKHGYSRLLADESAKAKDKADYLNSPKGLAVETIKGLPSAAKQVIGGIGSTIKKGVVKATQPIWDKVEQWMNTIRENAKPSPDIQKYFEERQKIEREYQLNKQRNK